MSSSPKDRRTEPRRDCFKVVRAIIGDRITEGTLRDLAAKGARLYLPNAPPSVPDSFDLYLDGDATRYPVRVIWRRGKRFGVIINSENCRDLRFVPQKPTKPPFNIVRLRDLK